MTDDSYSVSYTWYIDVTGFAIEIYGTSPAQYSTANVGEGVTFKAKINSKETFNEWWVDDFPEATSNFNDNPSLYYVFNDLDCHKVELKAEYWADDSYYDSHMWYINCPGYG
jgi:hypothetical protein